MVDAILVQNGKAHEIWRGTAMSELPPLHPEVVLQIVETPENSVQEGDIWDGTAFKTPPPPAASSPRIPKITIVDRMTDAEIAKSLDMRTGTAKDTAISASTQRRFAARFDAAASIDTADPATVGAFEALFGATRAAELLAPATEPQGR